MSNDDVKTIIQEIEYGEIVVKLDDLMNKKNISTYELSTKANIRFQTIQTMKKNMSTIFLFFPPCKNIL